MSKSAIKSLLVFPFFAAILLSGCAHPPRVVSSQPGKGGEISFKRKCDDCRVQAMEQAQANCNGKKVDVLNEGETVIGTKENNWSGSKGIVGWGGGNTTRQETEWRLTYACK